MLPSEAEATTEPLITLFLLATESLMKIVLPTLSFDENEPMTLPCVCSVNELFAPPKVKFEPPCVSTPLSAKWLAKCDETFEV